MHRADRVRNVALVGHRGSGKTSLNEALLFQAGAITRLGTVADGTTASDSDPDEQARQMSISASLSSFEWDDRKINLIDTPGEPSFVADAMSALRVCESAIFVVNAVMGVEVNTTRLWQRAAELDLARMVFVNMLDRERADFFRTLDALKTAFGQHVVATEIPIGSEHEVRGVMTRNLATNRLLDAIVDDLPSPVKHGALELPEVTLEPDPDAELFAYVFKTKADPFAGRINFFRVYQGTMKPDAQVLNTRSHSKERIGTLIVPQG